MTAAEKILQKALVTSGLDSSQWNRVQAGLRDRAFFSSQVGLIRVLHALRDQSAAATEGVKSDSEIRRDIREYLPKAGYNPGEDRGTIKDLFTKARLDVIIDTNRRQARGFAQHIEATTNGALRAFPAYELVRVYERKQKRDWISRWTAAGGRLYSGNQMIALKTDPIWSRINKAFGTPYPPFDWGSGMGVQDVSRGDCLALGVIEEDTPDQTPPTADFNGSLEASFDAGHWSGDLAKFLHEKFGDQINYVQDQQTGNVSVKWQRSILHDMFERPSDYNGGKGWALGKASEKLLEECDKVDPDLRKLVEGRGFSLNDSIVKHTIADGHWLVDNHKDNMPVTHGDVDLVPTMWRDPDYIERGKDNDSLVLCIECFDGGILKMPIHVNGNTPFGTGIYKQKGKSAEARPASIP